MIGPGTGIAPMRALIQEREHQAKLSSSQGLNVLFFGCRNRDIDYIYRDELEAYQSSGVLSELHLAFSRDGNKKVYVQHLISDPTKGASLAKLVLQDNAYIFVCGGTAMGNDVFKAVAQQLEQHGNMDASSALNTLENLQKAGRYVQELWSA